MSNRLLKHRQNVRDNRAVGMPHETALVSGFSHAPFVASEIMFPIVPVNNDRGEWREYGVDALKLIEGGIETPMGVGRKEVDIQVYKDDFTTVKVGLAARVFEDELRTETYDEVRDRKLERVAMGLKLYKEFAVSKVAQNTANYDAGFKETLAGNAQWDDYVNSDPSGDVNRWCLSLEDVHEFDRDQILHVAITGDVWQYVTQHPKLQQPVNGTNEKEPPTPAYLAKRWGVAGVHVLRVKHAVQPDPRDPHTITFKRMWKKGVFTFRKIDKVSKDAPLWGAVAQLKGFPDVKPPYHEGDKDCDVYGTSDWWGIVLRSKRRAHYANDVI